MAVGVGRVQRGGDHRHDARAAQLHAGRGVVQRKGEAWRAQLVRAAPVDALPLPQRLQGGARWSAAGRGSHSLELLWSDAAAGSSDRMRAAVPGCRQQARSSGCSGRGAVAVGQRQPCICAVGLRVIRGATSLHPTASAHLQNELPFVVRYGQVRITLYRCHPAGWCNETRLLFPKFIPKDLLLLLCT